MFFDLKVNWLCWWLVYCWVTCSIKIMIILAWEPSFVWEILNLLLKVIHLHHHRHPSSNLKKNFRLELRTFSWFYRVLKQNFRLICQGVHAMMKSNPNSDIYFRPSLSLFCVVLIDVTSLTSIHLQITKTAPSHRTHQTLMRKVSWAWRRRAGAHPPQSL